VKTNNRNSACIALLCLALGATVLAGAGVMNWTTGPGMILMRWLWTIRGIRALIVVVLGT
tara:strand:- start:373 stop:552 length:180 start_codon:yes stop_codon:yes gene_type:complete